TNNMSTPSESKDTASTPRTVPSSNESHATQQLGGQGSTTTKTKQKGALLAAHRSSHSHSHYYCYSLSSDPHRLATLNSTRASTTCSRHAPTLRRNVRHLLPQSNSSLSNVPHNRRHAPAAQHTQCHNVVPLLLNHERRVQRVLAHVLHALQPHADRVGCHALHLVVLVLGAHSSSLSIHGLGAARGCREVPRVWNSQMCGNNGHPHSLAHLHSLHSPTHKSGVMGKRSPPHNTYKTAQAEATPSTSHRKIVPCAQHTHGGNEGDETHPIPWRCPLLLSSLTGVDPHSQ
ncbi:hypothetical protein TcG_09711, partial [Trypanosoma cruzi]